MPLSRPAPSPRQTVAIDRFHADTFEMVFDGYVTPQSVAYAKSKVGRYPGLSFFLLDATRVSGYDADVRVPGVELLEALRESGVEYGVCVAPSSSVRLIGAAVCFVSNLKVDFVATRADAHRRLDERRSRIDHL